ncbi:Protein translocase subunit YajC [hydrothermal vent metagenome]|uniref:Protein translocase subunit YajC n=1 Tax=hydrothermal vent metagenome TaxID=652676 RepID=A0A3B1DYV8_9ZZZZ
MFFHFVLLAILNATPLSHTSAQQVLEVSTPPVEFVLFLQDDKNANKKADSTSGKTTPSPETAIKKTESKKTELKKGSELPTPDAKSGQEGKQAVVKKEGKVKEEQHAEPSWKNMIVMMAVAFAFFYFIILRPQQRERAKQKNKLESLKKNDRVVTIGGIIGTIANFSEDGNEVTLKIDDNARIKMLRNSVRGIYAPEDGNKKKEDNNS